MILVSLLLMANHSLRDWEFKGQPYICQPGQMVTSINSIVEVCGKGIADKKVRNALEKFVKHGIIKKESSTKNTLITFLNWNKYQKGEKFPRQSKDTEKASNGEPRGNQGATNNKANNENKEKNYNKNSYSVKQKNNFDSTKRGVKRNKFVNFEGSDYDYEAYERMEFERLTKRMDEGKDENINIFTNSGSFFAYAKTVHIFTFFCIATQCHEKHKYIH